MRNILKRAGYCLLAACLIFSGWKFHSPYLFKIRAYLPVAALLLGTLSSFSLWRRSRRSLGTLRAFDRGLILLLTIGACLSMIQDLRGVHMKKEVLNADPALLRKLGRHFVVGYSDIEELKSLVSHGAIGGVFITSRNIRGKSALEVKEEIDALQEIQAKLGLPPLWIATDQEGGIVSKLSPLVRTQPSLGEVVANPAPTPLSLREQVQGFARSQAEDLRSLGVNLNFSPVVDLKPLGPRSRGDLHTRIDLRAISSDPETVAEVALEYCGTLKAEGVMPTLKHFPGLASVKIDTHLSLGFASRSLSELQQSDWRPFQKVLANTDAFLMLGHVMVPELDSEFPASLSRKLVQKTLRRDWGYRGVLITDDFSMGPIVAGKGGVGAATLQALNAGVDLLLISYDSDLYYPAMLSLMAAEGKGQVAEGFLELSEARLALASGLIKKSDSHHQVANILAKEIEFTGHRIQDAKFLQNLENHL